jgi:hypothetical protein
MKDEAAASMRSLVDHWRANRVPYLGGVSDAELAAAERRFGPLPPAFKAHYRATDGTEVPGSEARTNEASGSSG